MYVDDVDGVGGDVAGAALGRELVLGNGGGGGGNMFGGRNDGALNDIEVIRNALVHATVTASFTLDGLGSSRISKLERGQYHARVDRYRRIVGLT